jgi:hypothetical protein
MTALAERLRVLQADGLVFDPRSLPHNRVQQLLKESDAAPATTKDNERTARASHSPGFLQQRCRKNRFFHECCIYSASLRAHKNANTLHGLEDSFH